MKIALLVRLGWIVRLDGPCSFKLSMVESSRRDLVIFHYKSHEERVDKFGVEERGQGIFGREEFCGC